MLEISKRADAQRPDNQFDTMRILAAALVLVSHSVPLSYRSDAGEVFVWLSHGQTTGGSIAVKMFFIISGYLVTASYLHAPSPARFVANRALRILPAYWFVLLLLAFVAGPLLSTNTLRQYFANSDVYRFLLLNMVFRYTEHLPGILLTNPFPGAIDGPLWTLRYEIACYGCVLLLGVTRQLHLVFVTTLFSIAFIVMLVWPADVRPPLACAFLAGSCLKLAGLPRYRWLAFGCVAGWGLAFFTSYYISISAVMAPYPILILATSRAGTLPKLSRYGDLSYGLYIYAFPWQQLAAQELGNHATWYWNVAVSGAPALLCAYLSWHFIEAPALQLKHGLQRRAVPWRNPKAAGPPLGSVKP